tara:strand:- start:353 stop:562 length:210 start_codon:yes stop_codon:yes gene_type:complete
MKCVIYNNLYAVAAYNREGTSERRNEQSHERPYVEEQAAAPGSRSFTAISVSSGDDLVDLRLLENTILI